MYSTPALLHELAHADWHDIESLDTAHQLERTDLPSQPGYFFVRKKSSPSQIYVARARAVSTWICLRCASTVRAARIRNKAVPFCPLCEKDPSLHERSSVPAGPLQ